MKAREREALRQSSVAELEHQLRAAQDELFRLRFQQPSKQLPNPLRIRVVRKQIARLHTLISQKTAGG